MTSTPTANLPLAPAGPGRLEPAASDYPDFALATQPGVDLCRDALTAAAVFAVDPQGVGGIRLRAAAGPLRAAWFARLRPLLALQGPIQPVPCQAAEARLLGGLDLAATLRAGKPVAERGLLASADQGVLLLQMAERLPASSAALVAAALDVGSVRLERDGFSAQAPARIAVIAYDEGQAIDELPAMALLDRLALWLDLHAVTWADAQQAAALSFALALAPPPADQAAAAAVDEDDEQEAAVCAAPAHDLLAQIVRARALLASVRTPDEVCTALVAACMALGIDSLRVPLLALRVARAAAAFAGASTVGAEHAAFAARLVIAPRARSVPRNPATAAAVPPLPVPPPAAPSPAFASPAEPAAAHGSGEDNAQGDAADNEAGNAAEGSDDAHTARAPTDHAPAAAPGSDGAMDEVVLAAARAALPLALLAALARGAAPRGSSARAGRTGLQLHSTRRGRPVGTQRGPLGRGARLHVLETLRAAAPWQVLRQGALPHSDAAGRRRIAVRPEDFRLVRLRQRSQTTVIFAVDTSGSAALSRLAEAKGAVELLLADCYVRRDQVALIAFRGVGAELLLPPTRSLARARRCLAGVPGGGGTPVAAGLRATADLADAVRRRGNIPLMVVLTDGNANIALDGAAGRVRAAADALATARSIRAAALHCLLVDFSARPRAEARLLAAELGARYLPLPRADTAQLTAAVRAARAAQQ